MMCTEACGNHKKSKFAIRPATEADAKLVLWFIQEFALFENKPNDVKATSEQLRQALAGPVPRIHVLLAFAKTDDGEEKPAAFVLYHESFDAWLGGLSISLKDLFVCSEYRCMGVEKLLYKGVADVAAEKNSEYIKWEVRSDNDPAAEFYKSVGAWKK